MNKFLDWLAFIIMAMWALTLILIFVVALYAAPVTTIIIIFAIMAGLWAIDRIRT